MNSLFPVLSERKKEESDGWSIFMTRFILTLFWSAVTIVAVISPAQAQSAVAAAPSVLDEIVVSATRLPTPSLETPEFVTVITGKQIQDSTATTLGELLSSRANVHVVSDGPAGTLTTVSVRGSTSTQVLVMVNGVPLASSRDGIVDLSQIPLSSVKRIEVVRGGESSVYGSNAIGGVINIITKGAEAPSVDVKLENGSYLPRDASTVSPSQTKTLVPANALALVDTQKGSATVSAQLGKADLTVTGGFTRAANGFVWNDTTGIGGWRRESNAGGTSANGYANLSAPVAGGKLSASASLSYTNYGSPGTLAYPSAATQSRTMASGAATYQTGHFLSDSISMTSHAFYQYDNYTYLDPAYGNTDSTTNSVGGDVTQKAALADVAALVYGASVRYDAVDSSDIGRRKRLNIGGYLSAPIYASGSITVTPSVRYDYFSDFSGGFSFMLGTVASLSESSALKASLYESYRVPTLIDLFYPGYANPNLKPETAYGGDIGYSVRGGSLSLDAALFTRYVLNQIVPDSVTYIPENLRRTLIPGIELQTTAQISREVTLNLNYSFIYSMLLADQNASYSLADDRRVPYVPMHSLAASVSYTHGGSRIAVGEQYVGKQYTDSANTESTALAGYVDFNLSYSQQISRNMKFTFSVKNLFNATYQTQSGYPMPPLSIWTGLGVRL